MSMELSRRNFVVTAAGVAAAALVSPQTARPGEFTGKIKIALKYNMVKIEGSVTDQFRAIKDIGYDGIELGVGDKVDRGEVLAASKAAGLPIHGVVNGSVNNIGAAVDLARFYGASSVLLVAGRVDAANYYAKNYATTQAIIREAIPYAKEQGILLLVENVWNNFLLTPLELARYIDELDSDQVAVYFDVGNVARFGWPEHWIPVLGNRIKKLDIKEYSRTRQMNEGPWKGFDVEIGDGEIDWVAVRKELAAIGYSGWATAEVNGGDKARLGDLAQRMKRVLDV